MQTNKTTSKKQSLIEYSEVRGNGKTILVTGCCGMIGFTTVTLLLSLGYKVIGIDNFLETSQIQHLYQSMGLEDLNQHKNFKFLNLDISKHDILYKDSLIKNQSSEPSYIREIDSIIHLAAHPGVKFSHDNPVKTLENNQQSFLKCLEIARILKVTEGKTVPVFFASSSSVYGNQDAAVSEYSTLNPVSIYALSKKHNEDVAKLYHESYGISCIALRFFTVYGPYNRPDMLVHKILNSIKYQDPLTLYKNGKMRRSFTFTEDIANCIVKLLQNPDPYGYDIFNIGSQTNIDLLSFVNLFEQKMNTKANLILVPDKPNYDPDITYCDTQKILTLFPELKFTDFPDGVEITVQWFKKITNI